MGVCVFVGACVGCGASRCNRVESFELPIFKDFGVVSCGQPLSSIVQYCGIAQ